MLDEGRNPDFNSLYFCIAKNTLLLVVASDGEIVPWE